MSSRRRPLHTCGVSFLAIAHSSCSRAQDLDGALGSTTRRMVRMAKLVSPLLFALQYQWLLILSFVDDRLLAIENIVEKIFPPSRLVFDKIDEFLHLIETFPRKLDDAIDRFPCFSQVLFLDWAVVHAISVLKSLITILMNWGREVTREKEILIDVTCNEIADKSEFYSEGIVSSVGEAQKAETGTMGEQMKSNVMKATYKKVLERGTKAVDDDEDCKENEKGTYREVLEKGTREEVEDGGDCKNNEKSTYKEVLEEGRLEEVEDREDCKNNEATYREVMEKGRREDCKNNEKHTYREVMEKGTREDCKNNEKHTYKEVLEKGTRHVEDKEACKNNVEGTYKFALKKGTRAEVEDKEDCRSDEKGTFKEVMEKGTRGEVEDKEDCKKIVKGTYKEVLEKGTREQVEDKKDCRNKEKGMTIVEDREDCRNCETNQSDTAKMECGEKAGGQEETADQSTGITISGKEGMKELSEGKDEKGTGVEQAEEMDYNEDDFLELYEAAWLMTPRKSKGNLLSR